MGIQARDEYAMFLAFAAALRSGDLSRQVGAVVASANNEIISTGANNVPRYGGGLYWADDKDNDKRDFKKGYDSNKKRRNEIVIGIMKKIVAESKSDSEIAISILNDLQQGVLGKKDMAEKLGKVKPTRYLNDLVRKMIANKLIEYTIPDKPGSRLQKYRLSDKGHAWLAAIQERLGKA